MRLILLPLPCFSCIYAQAQIRLGVQGGYSRVKWASINATSSNLSFVESYTTSGLSGFQTGVIAEVNLSHELLLRPSLFVSGKGTTLNRQSWYDTMSRGIWIQYIEVPVTLIYQVSLSSKLAGFAGGGIYAAQAFRGVEIGQSKTLSGVHSIYNEVELGTRNDGPGTQTLPTVIKPFDYGFTILAGVEVKSVQLLLTYSHGLTTVLPNGEPYHGNYANSGLTFSAAYLLSTQRIKH